MKMRRAVIVLHPILFCGAMFITPIASWPLIVGVSLVFCLLWEKWTDVLLSTTLLLIAVFPLALWIVSFDEPLMVLNLKPWAGLLYVAYGFLFLLPQLGLVAIRRAFQAKKMKSSQ